MKNQITNKKKLNVKEMYDDFLDIIFSFFLVFVLNYFLYKNVSIFRDDLKESKSYKENSLSNSIINYKFFYIFIYLALLKFLLQNAFRKITPYILKKQYKNPNDEKNYLLGKMYTRKLAIHLYKILFYTLIT